MCNEFQLIRDLGNNSVILVSIIEIPSTSQYKYHGLNGFSNAVDLKKLICFVTSMKVWKQIHNPTANSILMHFKCATIMSYRPVHVDVTLA